MNKEKVKELCEKWWAATKQSEDMVIEQWILQNQPKPIVVGLSDEQVTSLYENSNWCALNVFHSSYRYWEQNQKLAQPQQFKPNWNDAPDGATVFRVFSDYLDENKSTIHNRITIYEEQRPKPTPQVEVGQVWRSLSGFAVNLQIEVLEITQNSVIVWNDFLGKFDFEYEVFLSKFERVS